MNSLSRYRLSLTGLILAAVVVLLVGCTGAWDGGPFDGWGTGGGAIRWGTGVADGDPGGFGVSMSKVPAGSTVAFGAIILCVDGAASGTVRSVRFRRSDHLGIQRFALRRIAHTGLGADRASILDLGFGSTAVTVDTPCRDHAGATSTELGIDVAATAPGTVTGQTLIVSYAVGTRTGEVEVPMTIKLCQATSCG